MANQYKVPSLLPVPLIVVMVASVALPVLAYVMIYQVNTEKLESLDKQYKELRRTNESLRKRAETFKDEELAKDKYTLLQRSFEFRIFETADQAGEFWKNNVVGVPGVTKGMSERPGPDGKPKTHKYSVIEMGEADRDPVRISENPQFEEEWVGELKVTGTHRALMQFLIDLYNLRRRIFYPRAACARVVLKPGEGGALPFSTEEYLQVVADAARISEEPCAPGFYYEPWDMTAQPPRPLTADEVNDILTKAERQMPAEGYLWWVGSGIDEEKATRAKTKIAAGDLNVAKSVDFIVEQMAYFYSQEPAQKALARPFIQQPTPVAPAHNIDPQTGGSSWDHHVPVFLYIDKMQVRSTVNKIRAEHEMTVRVVFPIGWKPPADPTTPTAPVNN